MGSWRPKSVPCKNFRSTFIVELRPAGKLFRSRNLAAPSIVRLLDLAVQVEAERKAGRARFRADLAKANGLSAVRVSQILGLLKVAPGLVAFIRSLPAGTPARAVTERGLRRLTRLAHAEQMQQAWRMLPGFAKFVSKPE